MREYVYYVGYSHKRGFGSYAFVSTSISKFENVEWCIDFVRKEISRKCPHITYEEIVIISFSQIPLIPQKEGLYDRFRSLLRFILGGLKWKS